MATTFTALPTHNPLWSTLDTLQLDLPENGAGAAIGRLTASLARYRAKMAPNAWKASCANLDGHPAVMQLLGEQLQLHARTYLGSDQRIVWLQIDREASLARL